MIHPSSTPGRRPLERPALSRLALGLDSRAITLDFPSLAVIIIMVHTQTMNKFSLVRLGRHRLRVWVQRVSPFAGGIGGPTRPYPPRSDQDRPERKHSTMHGETEATDVPTRAAVPPSRALPYTHSSETSTPHRLARGCGILGAFLEEFVPRCRLARELLVHRLVLLDV